MPALTTSLRPPRTDAVESSVAALRAAVALVTSNEQARELALAGTPSPTIDSPLADWLYPRWWCGSSPREVLLTGDPLIAPDLEAARQSAASVESGHLVLASGGGRVVVARGESGGGTTLLERPAEAVVGSSRPGMPPRPGDLVDVLAGVGELDPAGAWWWAHSGDRPTDNTPLMRWYVNVSAMGAASAVAATVRLAAATGVPLSLKCPARVGGFGRRDSLVIYVTATLESRLMVGIESWHAELAPVISPDLPPLTRPIAPGVAAAHDPGGGISYGQLRCSQVAAAVTRWLREPGSNVRSAARPDRETAVKLLAAVGIHADRPDQVVKQ